MAKRPASGRSIGASIRATPGSLDLLTVAREIVAALPDAVVVTAVDRHLLTANRAAAELFGRPLEDLRGTPVDDLVVAAERGRVVDAERRAFEGEEQRYETR